MKVSPDAATFEDALAQWVLMDMAQQVKVSQVLQNHLRIDLDIKYTN